MGLEGLQVRTCNPLHGAGWVAGAHLQPWSGYCGNLFMGLEGLQVRTCNHGAVTVEISSWGWRGCRCAPATMERLLWKSLHGAGGVAGAHLQPWSGYCGNLFMGLDALQG